MAFGKTLVLVSPLAGRLVDGAGGALSGVTVARSWQDAYTGDSGRDECVSDGDGRFAFGEVIRSGALAGIVPHTPSITQRIEALLPGGAENVSVDKMPLSPVQQVGTALAKYAGTTTNNVTITTVGPTWGHDVSTKAIKALIIFFFLLSAYLAIRFEWKMSVAAIIAVIHDIIFTIGISRSASSLR